MMNCQLPDTQTLEGAVYSQDLQEDGWGTLYSMKDRFRTLVMTKSEYSIGRHPSCDIVLGDENSALEKEKNLVPESVQHYEKIYVGVPERSLATFSKLHFKIRRDTPLVVLEDHSSNGTHVNGKIVGKGKKVILQSNDQISIAHRDYKVYVFVDNTISNASSEIASYPPEIKDNYVVSRSLGKGAYGEVMLVFQKRTFERYAMKVVQKKTLNPTQSTKDLMMNEVTILKSLDHPCVINIHSVIDSSERLFIFLEFMEGGDLFDRVKLHGKIRERETKWIFYQISKAVEYLHAEGIAHRDLKPENILLSTNQENTIVKITDFGFSRFFNSQMVMQTLCGTPSYVAPEVLETRGCGAYSNLVDVWSMGVILYVCLSGSLPFNPDREDMTLPEQICSGSYSFPELPWRAVGKMAIELIKRMMTVNPKNRITVDMIISHPWFKDKELEKKFRDMRLFSKDGDENEPPRKRQRPEF